MNAWAVTLVITLCFGFGVLVGLAIAVFYVKTVMRDRIVIRASDYPLFGEALGGPEWEEPS